MSHKGGVKAVPGEKRSVEIDRLRGVAILFVLWHHMNRFFPWVPPAKRATLVLAGSTGVDLFFVISGFVVTASLLEWAPGTGSPAVRGFERPLAAFYLRRAFRLAPTCLFWLAFYWACSLGFNRAGSFGNVEFTARETFSILTLTYNYFIARGGTPNLVWHWSLTTEEQFYFIFPWFLLLVSHARKRIAYLFGAFLLSTFLVRPVVCLLYASLKLPDWPFVLSPPYLRGDAILAGCLLCLVRREAGYRRLVELIPTRRGHSLLVLALLAIVFFADMALGETMLSVTLPLVTLASVGVVALAAENQGLVFPGARWGLLGWFGKRSYVIYLAHCPLYKFSDEAWTRFAPALVPPREPLVVATYSLSTALLVFVATELCHRYVERPGMELGKRLASRLTAPEIAPERARDAA